MSRRHDPSLRTLPALLRHNAERDADRPFVIDEAGTLRRAEALDMALGMSAAFSALGVGRGETVAIMLDNRRELLESWFGLAFLGGIEVPINPANVGDRLVHIINHCRCSQLVVDADHLEQVDAVADRLTGLRRVIVVGEGRSRHFETVAFTDLERDAAAAPTPRAHFSQPAAVMYTSGSTGPAKGAVISHGQHYTNGHQPTALYDIGQDDVLYVCLPLHHNMAQGYGVCVALVSGAAIRIAPRFQADSFWPDIREHGATVLSFVGAMLVLLAKRPEREDDADNPLRVGFGVPIPAEVHEPFERRFGVRLMHGYGSTEATIVAWHRFDRRKVGAAGPPLPDFDVRILDEDDMALPPGQVGQICVRPHEPYSMFSEYFGDPEATVTAWRNLWFSDRLGDVVRRLGEFISSHEVEQVLVAHGDVQIAAAYGVPSELVEEEVMVAVVAQPGARLDAEQLRQWCRERLPGHAVPRFVELMDELPMTPTGKIEKYKLRRRGVTAATDDARAKRKVHG